MTELTFAYHVGIEGSRIIFGSIELGLSLADSHQSYGLIADSEALVIAPGKAIADSRPCLIFRDTLKIEFKGTASSAYGKYAYLGLQKG